MKPEFFSQIIKQVAPLTEQVCLHLMGDPLVHPRLEELVQICHEQDTKIFLVTNGVLLKDRIATTLLHPAFRQVCFSLHSFRDNFGDRDPTQYLDRIFEYTDQALSQRPDLYINFRLWNLESKSLEADGKEKQNHELLERVLARYPITDELRPADPAALLATNVRFKKSHRLKGRLYLHFDTEFIWPEISLPILGEHGTCYGLSNHFGILVDGTVVPCCLDKEGVIPLGSLVDQPLEKILNSPRAVALLKGFKNRKLIEPLCQRCQYIKRFD